MQNGPLCKYINAMKKVRQTFCIVLCGANKEETGQCTRSPEVHFW